MRIAIVNHCHPDNTHICAWRARVFAKHLVERGHDVLLLTAPLDETRPGQNLATLARHLHSQSKTQGYRHIALGYQSGSSLPLIRSGRVSTPFRQIGIATQFALHGNIFFDWVRGADAALPVVAEEFKPDIVWAIFGNSACWVIGQRLASVAGCPWVGDLKDSWPRFIPRFFRRLTASRFSDAAAMTAFSEAHADEVSEWLGRESTVVYSGIPDSVPERDSEEASPCCDILITGSLYDEQRLTDFMIGLNTCLETTQGQQTQGIKLVYAGNDTAIFDAAVERTMPDFPVERCGNLTPAKLRDRQRRALLNVYIRHLPNLFHHKLFELLASGRPVIAFGGETGEAMRIASESGTRFHACATSENLQEILPQLLAGRAAAGAGGDPALSSFTTKNQARTLERLLIDCIASQGDGA